MQKKNGKDVKRDVKKDVRKDDSGKTVKKKKSRKIKKSTIKKISTIVVLIAVLAVVLYFAFRTLKPEKVIAEVDGEIITKQEMEQQYKQLPDQYKLFITKDAFLDQMINVKLLLQEAEKQGISVSEAEIEEEIENLKKEAPTEEAFEQLLEQNNLGLEQLKEQLSEQLTINKLLDETVMSKVKVSDSKIKEYYNNNRDYFEESDTSYNEAKEQIRDILLGELSGASIEIYINQLRSDATIIKDGVKVTTKIETFTKTDDHVCKENGKIIIRLFSTTKNSASKLISQTFDEVVGEYGDSIAAYHWQLDTGDNTLTDAKENGVPKQEVEIFQKYNPKNTVPTYVFGCKYIRMGNSYKTLDEEEAEFKRVIEGLLV